MQWFIVALKLRIIIEFETIRSCGPFESKSTFYSTRGSLHLIIYLFVLVGVFIIFKILYTSFETQFEKSVFSTLYRMVNIDDAYCNEFKRV